MLDYEDFLRQGDLPLLEPNHPALMRFKEAKPQTLETFAAWVADERQGRMDKHGQTRTDTDNGKQPKPCQPLSSACLAANAALSLLNLACFFLDRQVERLARDFEDNGGFTERLYKARTDRRQRRA